MKNEEAVLRAANDLRRTVSDLLALRHPDRIVLAPGILVALRILFSRLQIGRILLTSEEYYGESHFPGERVRVAPCEAIPGLLRKSGFDALVASPASWRGVRQPVAELFGWIRKTSRERAPLLVADYAHAGSIGFPPAEDLGADVVCGDLDKWILPPDWTSSVGFLWIRTDRLFRSAAVAFRPFYLATQSSSVSPLARWVDPADILAVSRKLADLGVTRGRLQERHQANMKLAGELAGRLERSGLPETSILWFEGDELSVETAAALEALGLLWRLPGRGTRVLCRSDVAAADEFEVLQAGPDARVGKPEPSAQAP